MLPLSLGQEKETQNKAANKKSTDQGKSELVVGADAPDWSLPGSDGKTYKLSEFKNKKAVVVFWYPMALTGG